MLTGLYDPREDGPLRNQTSKILPTPTLKHPDAQHSHLKACDPGPPPSLGISPLLTTAPLYHPSQPRTLSCWSLLTAWNPLFCSLSCTPDWQQDPKPGWLQWPHFSSVCIFTAELCGKEKLPACVDWDIIRESLSQVDAWHWLPACLPCNQELRFTKYDYLTPLTLLKPLTPGFDCQVITTHHTQRKTETRRQELLPSSLSPSQPNFFFLKGCLVYFHFNPSHSSSPQFFKWRIISNIFRKLQRVPQQALAHSFNKC